MNIIRPSVELITPLTPEIGFDMIRHIEKVARTCYKSEDRITDDSAKRMVKSLIKSGHTAMIEHASLSVKFICSRAASHQLVRHRMASWAQESQRYCNYGGDKFDNSVTFISLPETFLVKNDNPLMISPYDKFLNYLAGAEEAYFDMLRDGAKPQAARLVLPNATKTEVNMTANFRELRAFFELRCDGHADDEIRCLAKSLLEELHLYIPVVFDDLYEKFIKNTEDEVYTKFTNPF